MIPTNTNINTVSMLKYRIIQGTNIVFWIVSALLQYHPGLLSGWGGASNEPNDS
jgi:hypothetical protein